VLDGKRPIRWISKNERETVVLIVEEDGAGFEVGDETGHFGDGRWHGGGRRRRVVSVGGDGRRVGDCSRRREGVVVVVVVVARRRMVG